MHSQAFFVPFVFDYKRIQTETLHHHSAAAAQTDVTLLENITEFSAIKCN